MKAEIKQSFQTIFYQFFESRDDWRARKLLNLKTKMKKKSEKEKNENEINKCLFFSTFRSLRKRVAIDEQTDEMKMKLRSFLTIYLLMTCWSSFSLWDLLLNQKSIDEFFDLKLIFDMISDYLSKFDHLENAKVELSFSRQSKMLKWNLSTK